MQQEGPLNTYCSNPECIKNKEALFVYSLDSKHVKENHNINNFHPITLSRMFAKIKDANGNLLEEEKNSLFAKISGYVDSFCEKMSTFMKEKYLNSFSDNAKSEIDKLKLNDPKEISKKIENGDYQMLEEIMNIEENKITKYPFHSYYEKKMQEVDNFAKNQIQQLYSAFEKIIDVTFNNKDDFLKIANGQLEDLSNETKKEAKKVLKLNQGNEEDQENSLIKPRHGNQSLIQREFSHNSSEYVDCLDDLLDERGILKRSRPKKKLISKPALDKKSKSHYDHLKERPLQRINSGGYNKVEDEITELNSEEIVIRKCKRVDYSFEYIKNKYKNVRGIHIFCSKIATKDYLHKILMEFKNLKILTLNCSHDFEYSILSQLSREALGRIENLELKWDFDLFFKQNQILRFFPQKEHMNIENIFRVYIPTYILEVMKFNKSLVLNSEKKILNLKDTNFNCSNIRTLHYFKARGERGEEFKEKLNLGVLNILIKNQMNGLITLNLTGTFKITKEIHFSDNEKEFQNLIIANPKIKNFNICHCYININLLNKIISALFILQNLKRFALTQRSDDQGQVEAASLFSLRSLEELYLSNTNIVDGLDRDMKSSIGLKNINNLKNLTHLSLYACNPIFSDFFQYFDPQVLNNLQFLNVGITEVGNNFLKCFPKMKKLLYLNIDEVEVTGDGLLKACNDFMYHNVGFPPLRYLSIENKKQKKSGREWSYSVEEMRQIGKCLPHLTYLEITQCRNLAYYDFAEFKSLSTLAMNKKMADVMTHLPPHIEKFYE